MSQEALFHKDNRARNSPGVDTPWESWVSATKTRNHVNGDPLLDWLELYGEAKGFRPDESDPRTDFGRFVMAKGNEFEQVVLRYIDGFEKITVIAKDRSASRSEAAVRETWEALAAGAKIVAQAPIWNPENQTYGVIDLAFRSDVLAAMFPGSIEAAEAHRPAPHLPGAGWHYRVVDIKFTGLDLLKDGHASSKHIDYAVQVFIYNVAIGRLQGLTAPNAYLLGRGWKQQGERGNSAMERLCRIDHGHTRRSGESLENLARQACDWIRRVRVEGGKWDALPTPSVPELWPNMKNQEGSRWSSAKKQIAAALEDLTLLPRVSPDVRKEAHAVGLKKWTDRACSASRLGINTPTYSVQLDAVIQANHSMPGGPIVFPPRVTANEADWRVPTPVEFFVDFETTNDLNDNFQAFPKRGGQPLIFMVGCGHYATDGTWNFRVFTVPRLKETEEALILHSWIEHMKAACQEAKVEFAAARIYHWSPAEVSTLETAYNSAAVRHGLPSWEDLPWVDLWTRVAKAEPLGVRGAFGYGLKAITKAMNSHGLIPTSWGDGPTDGLGAMVGAWAADAEAEKRGISMREIPLMQEIERYNQVDVEAMRDVLGWLRENR
jgi:hypothetical protein